MIVNERVTVTLTPDELRQILVDYVNSKGYKAEPKNVEFKIEHRMEGYGMAEHPVDVFGGCDIQCNKA